MFDFSLSSLFSGAIHVGRFRQSQHPGLGLGGGEEPGGRAEVVVCPRGFGGVKGEEERKPGLDPEMRCRSEKMQEMAGACVQGFAGRDLG